MVTFGEATKEYIGTILMLKIFSKHDIISKLKLKKQKTSQDLILERDNKQPKENT